jgi:steroid delta-isomerase-like uncharacterized protein
MRRRTILARTLALMVVPLLRAGAARAAAAPTEAPATLIRRIIDEAFNAGRLDIIDHGLAADYVDHQAGSDAPRGPEGFKGFVRGFRATFPDVHVTVEDLIAEGDKVALRVTWRGTQLGGLGGVPATGLPVEFPGFHVYRFENGKVTEHWGLQDDLSLLLQLGVVAPGAVPPTPGTTIRA